jgi:pyrroline-5-carboxylate reductase
VERIVLEDVLEVGEALLDPLQAIEGSGAAIVSLEEGGVQADDLSQGE